VALAEARGGGEEWASPLFWVKKEEITGGRKASRASKTKLSPLPR